MSTRASCDKRSWCAARLQTPFEPDPSKVRLHNQNDREGMEPDIFVLAQHGAGRMGYS